MMPSKIIEVLPLRRPTLAVILVIALSIVFSLTNAEDAIAEEDSIVLRGSLVPIGARLLQNGSYGEPVSGQRLDFYDCLLNSFIGSSLTDNDGRVLIYWNLTFNHPLGPTLLNVTFQGNDTLSLAPSCQWTTVTVVSATHIDLEYTQQIYHPGDQIPILVELFDDQREAIANGLIAIYHDDVLLAADHTNETGQVIFNIGCNTSWCSLGNNEIKVVYEPATSKHHNRSEHFIMVEVQQILTSIGLQDMNGTQLQLDEFLWLKLNVSAEGEGLPNANLSVLMDENFLSSTTTGPFGVTEQLVHIDYLSGLGPHRVRIEYGGTERYTAAYLEVDIVVKSPAMVSMMLPDYTILGDESQIQLEVHDSLGRPIPGVHIAIHDESTNETMSIPVPLGYTNTEFQYVFTGPTGIRNLMATVSGNPYLTNTTQLLPVTVWLKPIISIIETNIHGYASPGQGLSFRVQLNSSASCLPNRLIEAWINDTVLPSRITDSHGFANVTLFAPEIQGRYVLLLKINGSLPSYELSSVLEYALVVSRVMPVQVDLIHYIVSPELREVRVYLMIRCLNGTVLDGVTLNYEWLAISGFTVATQSGIAELILPMPPSAGVYRLYHYTDGTQYLHPSSGHTLIVVSEAEFQAAQGIGIPGLVLTLCVSVGLVGIPALYRKHLIS
ncbi:MAG: carboxypeptidase-like regulatory domain-containing protein [Candidatus Hermodarchaeota archaeon]